MITVKTIERERLQDAPFIGCLLSAISCNLNCKNCFNQHIKDLEDIHIDEYSLCNSIRVNSFEEGVILAGLEWSNQIEDMYKVFHAVNKFNLKLMIFTGMHECDFFKIVDINNLPKGTYVKFGFYDDSLKTIHNKQFGVGLATKNQYIKQF